MPRRRTKAAKPKVSLTPEEIEMNKNIPLLIKDFDKHVENFLREFEARAEREIAKMRSDGILGINKFSLEERNMLAEELAFPKKKAEKIAPAPPRESDVGLNVANKLKEIANPSRKRQASVKKVPQTATRTSTRKRARADQTPLHQGSSSVMATPVNLSVPLGFGKTPMITPKFNTMTPMNKTAHRNPRPNETLVSLSGSPVMATVVKQGRGKKKVNEDFAMIPLDNNLTLNLPLAGEIESGGLDLDEDQMKRLAIIQANITKMLENRKGSSSD